MCYHLIRAKIENNFLYFKLNLQIKKIRRSHLWYYIYLVGCCGKCYIGYIVITYSINSVVTEENKRKLYRQTIATIEFSNNQLRFRRCVPSLLTLDMSTPNLLIIFALQVIVVNQEQFDRVWGALAPGFSI